MNSSLLKLRAFYAASAAVAQSHLRFGQNIFSEDWDALIILDACRVDALREVQDEYDFLGTIESRWSRGSTSKEWIENTFTESFREEIESTIYLTSNYYSGHLRDIKSNRLEYPIARDETVLESVFSKLLRDDVVPAGDFGGFISLFDKLIGEEEKQLHPEKVTDCAIGLTRERNWDRFIVHYMQPHHPFLHAINPQPWHTEPFRYLSDSGDFEKVWKGYLGNLRLVLDHVEILLENLDANKVVITADHGEMFGPRGITGHGVGLPFPSVRRVPWVETTSRDIGFRNPEEVLLEETVSEDVIESRLEALGYK